MSDLTVTPSRSRMPTPPAKGPTTKVAAVGGTVVVEVGAEHTKYHVHRAFLAHSSEHFAKALRGPWVEAETGLVKPHDIEPAVFNIYMHWLYDQWLPDLNNEYEWYTTMDLDTSPEESLLQWLIEGYIFADRYLIPDFRHAINATIIQAVRAEIGLEDAIGTENIIKLVFDNVPADRPLLQLLVNQFCHDESLDYHSRRPAYEVKNLPVAFKDRVIIRLGELRRSSATTDHDKACYLECHIRDEEKEACGKLHAEFDPVEDYAHLSYVYG